MMTLAQAAAVLGARVQGDDATFTGVSTDTRTLKTGDLFIALRGENFDAHDFLEQARSAGAVAALVASTHTRPLPMPAIVVEDTRLALGRLAAHWRSRFSLPLVALTGSSGKTTNVSLMAINTLSTHPPRYPAVRPTSTAIAREIIAVTTPRKSHQHPVGTFLLNEMSPVASGRPGDLSKNTRARHDVIMSTPVAVTGRLAQNVHKCCLFGLHNR